MDPGALGNFGAAPATRLGAALARLDARQLGGAASLLLHIGILALVMTAVRDQVGYETPVQYMQVSLKTMPAPKAKKRKPADRSVAKKAKPAKKKPEKSEVDLDKLAAATVKEEKPVAPAPVAPPGAVAEEADLGATGAQTGQESAAVGAEAQASLVGVLPDWCPQDEALLSATMQEPALQSLYHTYIGAIKNRVSDNWFIPPVLAADAKCTIFIEQLVSGDIVRYEFAFCSGGEEFRHSVEEAIRRTTLPIPPDRRLYSRCIGFDFIPGEL